MLETFLTWLHTYESVAIWLEGIALVAIFILDWRQRIEQRKDREEQHKETLAQLKVSQEQVEASHKPFVALSTEPRNAEEAVLDMGGAVGEWSCDAREEM